MTSYDTEVLTALIRVFDQGSYGDPYSFCCTVTRTERGIYEVMGAMHAPTPAQWRAVREAMASLGADEAIIKRARGGGNMRISTHGVYEMKPEKSDKPDKADKKRKPVAPGGIYTSTLEVESVQDPNDGLYDITATDTTTIDGAEIQKTTLNWYNLDGATAGAFLNIIGDMPASTTYKKFGNTVKRWKTLVKKLSQITEIGDRMAEVIAEPADQE